MVSFRFIVSVYIIIILYYYYRLLSRTYNNQLRQHTFVCFFLILVSDYVIIRINQ